MSRLFTPVTIKSITLKNRIAMAPMCQYSAKDGFSNHWHLTHYGARAVGGAGLIIQEATAVTPEGRITPGDLGIWSDEHVEGFKMITSFIHRHGSVAGIQIAHAGRKGSCAVPDLGGKQLDLASGGWQTLAPSDIPFNEGDRVPHQLSKEEILLIVSQFKDAAGRAVAAGYKVLEIHSAHGYLLQEFLSPLSNKRTDNYGGSFENRIRLLTEVVGAVKLVWPEENPLFVRISAFEWVDGGWTIDESVKLATILKDEGVDLIDCSSGGNISNAKIPFGPNYQVLFAEAVKKTGILAGAVGLITSATQAESILNENKADIILLGRELLRNPYFPLFAARELKNDISWPTQYIRAK